MLELEYFAVFTLVLIELVDDGNFDQLCPARRKAVYKGRPTLSLLDIENRAELLMSMHTATSSAKCYIININFAE